MSSPNIDPAFFRREMVAYGMGMGFLLGGLAAGVVAIEQFGAARDLSSARAEVRYDAPGEAAIRASLQEAREPIENKAHTYGIISLAALGLGAGALSTSVVRWNDAYPRPKTVWYWEQYSQDAVPAEPSPAQQPEAVPSGD